MFSKKKACRRNNKNNNIHNHNHNKVGTMSSRFARASLLHDYLLHNTSYHSLLPPEERRRRDRRLPRCSIRKYKHSPFKYMYDSKNEQALLNTTGLDHRTFQELLILYEPFFKKYMWDKKKKKVRLMKLDKFGRPYRRKPRDMDAAGSLGLILTWYRTRGACTRNLSFTFGLTSSQMFNWILFGRRVLLSILQKHPLAKISLPTTKEINQYTNAVHAK